jgi:hypothetical protein
MVPIELPEALSICRSCFASLITSKWVIQPLLAVFNSLNVTVTLAANLKAKGIASLDFQFLGFGLFH